jgi:hypothetical protein
MSGSKGRMGRRQGSSAPILAGRGGHQPDKGTGSQIRTVSPISFLLERIPFGALQTFEAGELSDQTVRVRDQRRRERPADGLVLEAQGR